MLTFYGSVSSTVVGGGEYDVDVEVGRHVPIEVGDERVAVVRDGRGGQAEPGDPAINEGPADVTGGGGPKGQGFKPPRATIVDTEKVSEPF